MEGSIKGSFDRNRAQPQPSLTNTIEDTKKNRE